MTSSGNECLCHSAETKPLSLPTSPFLLNLLYYEIALTAEFLYRIRLGAQLAYIGRMCRRKPNDLWAKFSEFTQNK